MGRFFSTPLQSAPAAEEKPLTTIFTVMTINIPWDTQYYTKTLHVNSPCPVLSPCLLVGSSPSNNNSLNTNPQSIHSSIHPCQPSHHLPRNYSHPIGMFHFHMYIHDHVLLRTFSAADIHSNLVLTSIKHAHCRELLFCRAINDTPQDSQDSEVAIFFCL